MRDGARGPAETRRGGVGVVDYGGCMLIQPGGGIKISARVENFRAKDTKFLFFGQIHM